MKCPFDALDFVNPETGVVIPPEYIRTYKQDLTGAEPCKSRDVLNWKTWYHKAGLGDQSSFSLRESYSREEMQTSLYLREIDDRGRERK